MFMTRLKVAMALLLTAFLFAGGVRSDDPAKKEDKGGGNGPPGETFKVRLKKYEGEIAKIRQAMLNECAEEEQRLEEARKKAKEDSDKAKKGKDQDTYKKALAVFQQATADKKKDSDLRADVEKRIQVNTATGGPIEERVGLKTSALTPLVREQFGLSKDEGLAVDKVTPDLPAAKIGLKVNDILLKVDDKPVPATLAGFRTLLTALKSDKSAEVVVLRHAKQEILKGLTAPVPE
jgi:hypothetical protein